MCYVCYKERLQIELAPISIAFSAVKGIQERGMEHYANENSNRYLHISTEPSFSQTGMD